MFKAKKVKGRDQEKLKWRCDVWRGSRGRERGERAGGRETVAKRRKHFCGAVELTPRGGKTLGCRGQRTSLGTRRRQVSNF